MDCSCRYSPTSDCKLFAFEAALLNASSVAPCAWWIVFRVARPISSAVAAACAFTVSIAATTWSFASSVALCKLFVLCISRDQFRTDRRVPPIPMSRCHRCFRVCQRFIPLTLSLLREMPADQSGDRWAALDFWTNDELKQSNSMKVHFVLFDLHDGSWRTEIPLLPHQRTWRGRVIR
jgi:hypothetical protein